MRKFQVSIKLQYISKASTLEEVSVYADSNNVWEALCAAAHRLIDCYKNKEGVPLPSDGALTS